MTHSRHSPGSRDKNEKPITEYLRRANVLYFLLPEGAGADILLYTSPMMLIEIKNPDTRKDAQKLTEKEKEIQAHCKEIGIPYHVIFTPEEMAVVINQYIEHKDALRISRLPIRRVT